MVEDAALVAQALAEAAQVVLAEREHHAQVAHGQFHEPVDGLEERLDAVLVGAGVEELLDLVQVHQHDARRAPRGALGGGEERVVGRARRQLPAAEAGRHRTGEPARGLLRLGPAVHAHHARVFLLDQRREHRRLEQGRLAGTRRAVDHHAAVGEDAAEEPVGHVLAAVEPLAISGAVGLRAGEGVAGLEAGARLGGDRAHDATASSCAASSAGSSVMAAMRPFPGSPPPPSHISASAGSAPGARTARLSLGAGR